MVSVGVGLVAILLAATAPPVRVEPSPVVVDTVTVSPAAVRGETLCQLVVGLRNAADFDLSAFRFRVVVEGHALPAYERRVFVETLPAGERREIRLYNFWSAESGRPAPTDAALDVEVELVEARRLGRSREASGEEVWKLGDAVAGLPSKRAARISYSP